MSAKFPLGRWDSSAFEWRMLLDETVQVGIALVADQADLGGIDGACAIEVGEDFQQVLDGTTDEALVIVWST